MSEFNLSFLFNSDSGSETVPPESDFWEPDPKLTWSPVPNSLSEQWHSTSTLWNACSITPTAQLHHGPDLSTLNPEFLLSLLPPAPDFPQTEDLSFPQPGV
jgi:hypothetical protein